VVELDQVSDPALVVNAVAVSVGLREQAGRAPLQMLTDYLASRHLLLVLDNSEHVIEAIADLADSLLQACPHLRILATSREWLGIAGEVIMPVPPLGLPDADQPESRNLLQYGAVKLFVDRAAAVLSDYDLTDDNRFEVAEICRRLDGLPLAIELAAARLRALSEKEVLARLSDHPHLLDAALLHRVEPRPVFGPGTAPVGTSLGVRRGLRARHRRRGVCRRRPGRRRRAADRLRADRQVDPGRRAAR
jgi:non-specific serine/threonine protein kinase